MVSSILPKKQTKLTILSIFSTQDSEFHFGFFLEELRKTIISDIYKLQTNFQLSKLPPLIHILCTYSHTVERNMKSMMESWESLNLIYSFQLIAFLHYFWGSQLFYISLMVSNFYEIQFKFELAVGIEILNFFKALERLLGWI